MVVAYASALTLKACLSSLPVARLHGVVVVDNDSPDDSAGIARATPGVRVVEQANRGFGAGCNAGAAALPGAELLLFLNPDAAVDSADLSRLVTYLDAHHRCALVGPRLFSSGRPITSGGRKGTLATELRTVVPAVLSRRFPDRRLPATSDHAGPVGYVEGACFLVRAAELREVGGFDEAFFLFFEEMDLARRLDAHGWSVDLEPAARAEHQSAVSRGTLSDGGRSHLLRSTVLYLHKVSPWQAGAYVVLARGSLLVRSCGGLDRSIARAWSRIVRTALRDAKGAGT